jgi:hypothetical protein
MIRPAAFGFNPATAATNVFQSPSDREDLVEGARREFDRLVREIRDAGIDVLVADDGPDPPKPDALFPNNWISTHAEGSVVLYPLEAVTRRPERRGDIVLMLKARFQVRRVIDLSGFEARSGFLEGTGSLVLDRVGRRAYAARSTRTGPDLVRHWGLLMGYETWCFETAPVRGLSPYHTNVLMAIGTQWAVVGSPLIRDPAMRKQILMQLRKDDRAVVELTPGQIENFAANLLELETPAGPVIVGSDRAWSAFAPDQLRRLESCARILSVPLEVIESVGGGSARCMIAELFLPLGPDPGRSSLGADPGPSRSERAASGQAGGAVPGPLSSSSR